MASWRWKVTVLPERSDIGEQVGAEEEVEVAVGEEGGGWKEEKKKEDAAARREGKKQEGGGGREGEGSAEGRIAGFKRSIETTSCFPEGRRRVKRFEDRESTLKGP
ncbi:hypothetical protein Avbf_01382 [Armadillidium vulgare]|nr:hypothetical protein Avbf_01382 [Armadillidium vulgare]